MIDFLLLLNPSIFPNDKAAKHPKRVALQFEEHPICLPFVDELTDEVCHLDVGIVSVVKLYCLFLCGYDSLELL